LRRNRLVTVAEEHDGIDWIRSQHLLYVHGHEIAIEHGGRFGELLAERNRGEFERKTASRDHTALHGRRDLTQVIVTIIELAPGISDADHWPSGELVHIDADGAQR